MRRDIGTILTAHRIDPTRIELYVEGVRDKSFLDWLVPRTDRDNAAIILIGTVNVPNVTVGGNRERVLTLLRSVLTEPARIRGLVDADAVHLSSAADVVPSNAWLTDRRDLESYVLSKENLYTALQLGCGRDGTTAPAIYESMVRAARWSAAVRLVSANLGLDLPVSSHRWLRYAGCDPSGNVHLATSKIVASLLQAGGISLSRRTEVTDSIDKIEAEFQALPDEMVIHGKDAMALLTKQFQALGIEIVDVTPVMWTTFRNEHLSLFPTLTNVVRYLRQ